MIEYVQELYDDKEVNGILVQLPLPEHMSMSLYKLNKLRTLLFIDEDKVLSIVKKDKDVDGLHPLNIADLCIRGKTPRFVACTPQGCLYVIKKYIPDLTGLRAAVLGRSNIVGMPMFLLLQRENATVTL